MLVAVTDHAAERFRQRVRGTLDAKTEIAARVARAREAGRVEPGERGTILVREARSSSTLTETQRDLGGSLNAMCP